jgi:hypothetical protein
MGKYADAARRAVDTAEDADVDIPVRNPANAALWLFLK